LLPFYLTTSSLRYCVTRRNEKQQELCR
jgi:hypothetical protein